MTNLILSSLLITLALTLLKITLKEEVSWPLMVLNLFISFILQLAVYLVR